MREHAQRPIVVERDGHFCELIDGLLGNISFAAPDCGLDEFVERSHGVVQLVGVWQFASGGVEGLGIAAKSVVEDRLREIRGADRIALATSLSVGADLTDQPFGSWRSGLGRRR